MAIGIDIRDRDITLLLDTLKSKIPRVPIYTNFSDPRINKTITCLLCWGHHPGRFDRFPNLKMISSLGAGVDHIFQDPSLPTDIPITRIVDPTLTEMMSIYVRTSIKQSGKLKIQDPTIGIMGMGKIGLGVAIDLKQKGYKVIGYSRTQKDIEINHFTSEGFTHFLSLTDILICLLPLTLDTYHILNDRSMSNLPKGAYIVNVGRHDHIDYKALLKYVDNGHLSGACLDVCSSSDPLYSEVKNRETILVTPHIASITDQEVAGRQLAENYKRKMNGIPLFNQAKRKMGY